MLSEDALRAGAVACFTNAQDLYNEAQLLYEQARSPRAAALALIGAEEFAKAVLFTSAALLSEQRHRLPCRLESPILAHHICTMAEVAQLMASELWDIADEFGGTTALSRLGDLFGTLTEWGLDGLLNAEATREYDSELDRKHEEASRDGRRLEAHPERDLARVLREPDGKKAALYVELDTRGKVRSPTNRVAQRDVRASIGGLAYLLVAYAALPTVVGDDQRWRDFAECVRHGQPEIQMPRHGATSV